MGLLGQIGMRVRAAARALAGRALTDPSLTDLFGVGAQSSAGIDVNEQTAISATGVLCALQRICEDTAMLPLALFERDADGNKNQRREHPLWRVLHDVANPEMTAMEARSQLLASVLLHGNGYAQIVRDRAGRVLELWPIRQENVTPWRSQETQQLVYTVTVNGKTQDLSAQDIFHLRGFTTWGVLGLSMLQVARDTIGLSKAQEVHASTWFKNGARPSSILEFPNALAGRDEDRVAKAKVIQAMIAKEHGGPANSNKVMIVDNGGKFSRTQLSPAESQLLEGRTFQLGEIARVFCMPLHLLAELSHATFTNIEAQGLEYVVYCLGRWMKRIEQRIYLQLLSPAEQRTMFAEHNPMGLLRGDAAARASFYRAMNQMGVLSLNEIRALENLNGIGPEGDQRLVQVNQTPLDQLAEYMAQKNGGLANAA